MSLNWINDKTVANYGDDDMIGPKAKRKKLDRKLFSWAHQNLVAFCHPLAIWWFGQEIFSSDQLQGHKYQSIQPVQKQKLVYQCIEAVLGDLHQENIRISGIIICLSYPLVYHLDIEPGVDSPLYSKHYQHHKFGVLLNNGRVQDD